MSGVTGVTAPLVPILAAKPPLVLFANALLGIDTLLIGAGSALFARGIAGSDTGAHAVHWLTAHAGPSRHLSPTAALCRFDPSESPALHFGKRCLQGGLVLVRTVLYMGVGYWLGGDAGFVIGAQVALGLVGATAGATAGALDRDVRMIKRHGLEAIIREQLSAGMTTQAMQQWLDQIARRLTETSFRLRRPWAHVQPRQALYTALERLQAERAAAQRRVDARARRAATAAYPTPVRLPPPPRRPLQLPAPAISTPRPSKRVVRRAHAVGPPPPRQPRLTPTRLLQKAPESLNASPEVVAVLGNASVQISPDVAHRANDFYQGHPTLRHAFLHALFTSPEQRRTPWSLTLNGATAGPSPIFRAHLGTYELLCTRDPKNGTYLLLAIQTRPSSV